jgi:predicted RNA binding protein YcfA (HicA-like mRNA interferase family)
MAPYIAPRRGDTHGGYSVRLPLLSMPPLPRITGREIVDVLKKLGWVVVTQKGSHAQLRHPTRDGRVTVPLHAGETIGPGLLRSILAQAGITVEEFRTAL